MQKLRAQGNEQPGFLAEGSPELATSGLVQRLENAVNEASPGNRSCAISNRSPLNNQTTNAAQPYQKVAVQVRLRCGIKELTTVLYTLEKQSPRLFIDNLDILSQRGFIAPNVAPDPAMVAQMGGLEVGFDLYGYLLPQANTAEQGVATAP